MVEERERPSTSITTVPPPTSNHTLHPPHPIPSSTHQTLRLSPTHLPPSIPPDFPPIPPPLPHPPTLAARYISSTTLSPPSPYTSPPVCVSRCRICFVYSAATRGRWWWWSLLLVRSVGVVCWPARRVVVFVESDTNTQTRPHKNKHTHRRNRRTVIWRRRGTVSMAAPAVAFLITRSALNSGMYFTWDFR